MPAAGTSSSGSGGHASVFARFKRHGSSSAFAHADATTAALTLDTTPTATPIPTPSDPSPVHIDERGAVTGGKAVTHRRESSLFSLTTTVTGSAKDLKRSLSVRSHRTTLSSGASSLGNKSKTGSAANDFTPLSSASPVGDDEGRVVDVLKSPLPPPSAPAAAQQPRLRRKLSLSAKGLSRSFKSTEALPELTAPTYLKNLAASSPPIHRTNTLPAMLAAPPPAPVQGGRKPSADHRPGLHPQTSFNSVVRDISTSHSNGAPLQPTPSLPTSMPGGPLNPNTIYTQMQETATKRMATIEYLRKLHEGDMFHFNMYHYSQASLATIPSMAHHKLGRRATNYFLLGYSLPAVLDMNSGTPLEYLKALSALLTEFEEYRNLSGFDASGNAVSKGRMGSMFKSGMGFGGRGTKGRRSSTAIAPDNLSIDTRQAELLGVSNSGRGSDVGSPQDMSVPINPSGHEFAYLLTPHIPFEPDFITTLGTLCDTLVDVYAKLMEIIGGPDSCTAAVGDAFAKADKAIRKILISNLVREFEDNTRAGMKGEIAGLGKLTLGGLM
ncbi:uncharacterized protein MYCFIDRAFT_195192 [Pseudocercospora fijiensis CIRAD86]|uniref:Uncharacterized protein n=1 Tax=Pseudocercospora fijiensis (strain CIRAD86) TaxID=383855 RepID=M2Z2F4_PSEFD|nr:uncharacterized protein MYCFIDRAFT_195192 [Pseudocercospora fijiensis CIRAD86]EME84020.1 hypothetical protein MYCFIDRAFT_195192 [Pseudocercospora fijiensis CIRAD86]